jgi:hypothetical protein
MEWYTRSMSCLITTRIDLLENTRTDITASLHPHQLQASTSSACWQSISFNATKIAQERALQPDIRQSTATPC